MFKLEEKRKNIFI